MHEILTGTLIVLNRDFHGVEGSTLMTRKQCLIINKFLNEDVT